MAVPRGVTAQKAVGVEEMMLGSRSEKEPSKVVGSVSERNIHSNRNVKYPGVNSILREHARKSG